MHKTSPVLKPPMPINWSRRRNLLNRMLLAAALILATLGIVSVQTQSMFQVDLASVPAIALFASAGWLFVTYLFGRMHRPNVSGWMITLFCLVWFGLALYLLPDYTLALLPAAVLPIALAVLLLDRVAVLSAAALTISTVLLLTTNALPTLGLPAAALIDQGQITIAQRELGLIVVSITVGMVALTLLPLRRSNSMLKRELVRSEDTQQQTDSQIAAISRERDEATLLAQRQQQYIEAVIGQIRDGAVSVNAAGEIVLANPAARQILAETKQHVQDKPLLANIETALISKNGQRVAELLPLPTFDLAPEAIFTHMLLDRRDEARLTRLRGELLGMLTDDMRNPLTSMVTALDLTLGQHNLPEEVNRVLIGARQSGKRLLELVTMLLEISQIEQDPTVLRRSSTSLLRVIEAGIAHMSPLAQRGAVTVSVEHAGDSGLVVDSDRIERAFSYLLEQALRQSPPYSIVQVRTRRSEGELVVQITDQGPGRSVQQSEHTVRQGGNERSTSSLALIYSKLVVEAHGGRVWAENNGSQGNSYSFALPLDKQELVNER